MKNNSYAKHVDKLGMFAIPLEHIFMDVLSKFSESVLQYSSKAT